jgi:predicted ATPase/DNA-binding CsgD family transcriptional regulator
MSRGGGARIPERTDADQAGIRERHNLPLARTRLIGREDDAAAVRHILLDAESRLVTLTGAGGCGKTRLALEVAAGLVDLFPDGVWLVELASLVDPALLTETVAAPLGVQQLTGRTLLEALIAWLEPRHLLVVLDNCEHLVDACARLVDRVLSACDRVRVLATSREPLRVDGEITWRVPSLAVPELMAFADPDQLTRSPAVRLLVERARTVQRTFQVTHDNGSAVAQICARLDGMPLALELAAAWARALSVKEIAERLEHSFGLLTGGSRSAPARHQTLRATLDWSHTLLSPAEQVVFRRLSVFAGGFSVAAAEAVCADEVIARVDVLDLLTALVDKSLALFDDHASETRYRLLEPVRQYALEHLSVAAECAVVAGRHAAYYLGLAEQAAVALWAPHTTGPFGTNAQIQWQSRLEQEHDNLRVALAWAEQHDGADSLARWCAALWGFWFLRAHLDECRYWVERTLGRGDGLPPEQRARLLGQIGTLAKQRREYASAIAPFDEALRLFRSVGDEWNTGAILSMLGMTLGYLGDLSGARERLDECVAVYRQLSDPWGVGFALLNSSKITRASGDQERSRALLEEALPLLRQSRDVFQVLEVLIDLGSLALDVADHTSAANYLRDGLIVLRDSGMRWYLPETLELAAGLAAMAGRFQESARLFGAAEMAREITGAARQAADEQSYVRNVERCRAVLDQNLFSMAWSTGGRLSVADAISDASALAESPATPAAPTGAAGPLSPREWEVVALLARGLSNPQIAEELVISRRTADRHVSNILNKLGFATRGQIAAWAFERRASAQQ